MRSGLFSKKNKGNISPGSSTVKRLHISHDDTAQKCFLAIKCYFSGKISELVQKYPFHQKMSKNVTWAEKLSLGPKNCHFDQKLSFWPKIVISAKKWHFVQRLSFRSKNVVLTEKCHLSRKMSLGPKNVT